MVAGYGTGLLYSADGKAFRTVGPAFTYDSVTALLDFYGAVGATNIFTDNTVDLATPDVDALPELPNCVGPYVIHGSDLFKQVVVTGRQDPSTVGTPPECGVIVG